MDSVVESNQQQGTQGSRGVVVGCLMMSTIRAFVCSGLEGATSLLLEATYHWDERSVGLAISATALCMIPLKTLHNVLHDRLTVTAWIRIMSLSAVFGVSLLSKDVCS